MNLKHFFRISIYKEQANRHADNCIHTAPARTIRGGRAAGVVPSLSRHRAHAGAGGRVPFGYASRSARHPGTPKIHRGNRPAGVALSLSKGFLERSTSIAQTCGTLLSRRSCGGSSPCGRGRGSPRGRWRGYFKRCWRKVLDDDYKRSNLCLQLNLNLLKPFTHR